jgi:hypothetical protein
MFPTLAKGGGRHQIADRPQDRRLSMLAKVLLRHHRCRCGARDRR